MSLAGNEDDAQAIFKMITVFYAGEDKLAGLTNEVQDGLIVRVKTW